MVDMTATGWDAPNATGGFGAAVQVLQSWRPLGGRRQALVQLTMSATNFGNGAHVYPGEGIPLPNPTTVGFRRNIDYVIPLCPFTAVTTAGRVLSWGCVPETYSASGNTTPGRIKVAGLVGSTPSQGPTSALEAVSTLAASDLFTTSAMRAFGIFVGG